MRQTRDHKMYLNEKDLVLGALPDVGADKGR